MMSASPCLLMIVKFVSLQCLWSEMSVTLKCLSIPCPQTFIYTLSIIVLYDGRMKRSAVLFGFVLMKIRNRKRRYFQKCKHYLWYLPFLKGLSEGIRPLLVFWMLFQCYNSALVFPRCQEYLQCMEKLRLK